jgi:DNA-binding CsgD family transcriptional regulator
MFESDASELTPTERAIVTAVIRSGSVTRASLRAGRTLATTRVHMKHIHRKTGTHSVGELIVWALRHPDQWAS